MKKIANLMLSMSVLSLLLLSCDKTIDPLEVQTLNEELSTKSMEGRALKNFTENFEHDLSKWTGNRWIGRDYSAIIVDDPLRPDNKVVTFKEILSGGDIYGSQNMAVLVEPGNTCVLTFEYLGIPGIGGTQENLGGAIGATVLGENDEPLGGLFFACTVCDQQAGCKEDMLIDDGQWHKYTIEFDPYCPDFYYGNTESINTVVVMVEDWSGSGGVAEDVFFDKIKLKVKK